MNETITGLIEFVHSAAKKNPLPRSTFTDTPIRTLYSTGIDFPTCNGVIEKSSGKLKLQDVKEAVSFFTSKKLPFVWWTEDKLLETEGFQFGGLMKGLTLDTAKSKSAPPPSGVTVKVVHSEEELNDFCRILSSCFGFIPEVEKQYVKFCKTAMDNKDQIHFMAYMNGIPVATTTLSTQPNSAGIWNSATLPEYRKKGIGTYICSVASKHAQELKYPKVISILMPKGLAWSVFDALGYKEVSTLPFYMYGTSHNVEK